MKFLMHDFLLSSDGFIDHIVIVTVGLGYGNTR